MQNNSVIHCEKLVPQQLPFDYAGSALDFDLAAGEVSSIIGPDYSGKGNWIRTLCGLEELSPGALHIDGIDTLNLSADDWVKTRIKVAYLHEDTALLSAVNGLVNTLVPALYHQHDKKPEKQLLAEKALDLLAEIDPDIKLAALKNRTSIAFLRNDDNKTRWLQQYKTQQNSVPKNTASHLARILRFEAELTDDENKKNGTTGTLAVHLTTTRQQDRYRSHADTIG